MNCNDLTSLQYPLREDVQKLVQGGYVALASKQIIYLLEHDLVDEKQRARLELEQHLLAIEERDYPYDKEEALKLLRTIQDDATEDTLDKYRMQGFADYSLKDGEIHYHKRFIDTLLKTNPLFLKKNETSKDMQLRISLLSRMKERGHAEADISVHIGLRIASSAYRKGEVVSIDLPLPVQSTYMSNVRITAQSAHMIGCDPVSSKRRYAHFRGVLEQDEECWIECSYTNSLVYNDMDRIQQNCKIKNVKAKSEAPYLVRTPYLEALAKSIVGFETNPVAKARLIYEYITHNVRYSFVRSYQSIANLAEYGAANRKGDCGIQAALFIELCRICMIKANWQGGMYVTPYEVGNHDWATFEVPGYGTCYADCSFGGGAHRLGNTELERYYFGNLDVMRLPCCNALAYRKDIPSEHWFDDPTDNQRGEAYYDSCSLTSNDLVSERKTLKFMLRD